MYILGIDKFELYIDFLTTQIISLLTILLILKIILFSFSFQVRIDFPHFRQNWKNGKISRYFRMKIWCRIAQNMNEKNRQVLPWSLVFARISVEIFTKNILAILWNPPCLFALTYGPSSVHHRMSKRGNGSKTFLNGIF